MRQAPTQNKAIAARLLVTISLSLFAAAGSLASGFSVRTWQSDVGLPDNRVTGVVQGPEGYLWVSTHAGLCRFDGVRFQQVELPEIPGTPHHLIRAMLLGQDQSIWLALDGGVAMQIPGEGRVLMITNGLPDLAALSMAQDSTGAVWISYHSGSVRSIEGSVVTHFGGNEGLPGAIPCWLTSDGNGRIWFTKGPRVGMFKEGRFVTLHQFEEQSLRLGGAQAGGVWVRAGRRLIRMKEGEAPKTLGLIPMNTGAVDPTVLFEDGHGSVWVGSSTRGLVRYAQGQFENVETLHPEIRSITQDREGSIWLGTGGGGLNRLRPRVIELHSEESGLPFEVVQSVCEDANGLMWVTMQNGTLAKRQGDVWTRVAPTASWPANDATCVTAEPHGGIWLGTRRHGLYLLQEGHFSHWNSSTGLASDYIRSLLVDGAGRLWVGQHWSNCVQRFDQEQFTTVVLPPESEAVRAMTEDLHGAIWTGDARGNLYRIEDDRFTEETPRTLHPPRPIRSLQATSDGSIWIGYSGGGLGWIRSNQFVHIGPREGLSQQDVSQIVPDAQSNLWLGGNRGVSQLRRMDLDDLATGRTERIHVFPYGQDEGFRSLQANYGYTAGGLRSRDGKVWLPMRTGLVEINTEQVLPNLLPPPVVIERALLDGRELQFAWTSGTREYGGPFGFATPALHLPPQHRKLEFDFTAPSFIAPETIRFRYKLTGLDEGWVEAGTDRRVVYPQLHAGTYRFQVTACNNSGVWNDLGAMIDFTVAPFVWQTWWFRTAIIASFTLGLVALVRYISFRRLRQQVQHLEQESILHNERARIARDLHDDLGANLTQIALLSELARHDLEHPEQAEGHMDKVANRARTVIKTLDEIVWAVNPRNDTLSHLLEYIGQFAVDFLSAAEIRCRVDFPDHPGDRPLAGEDRHNLYLAVKEALNNIVKHAHASEVWLRATVTAEGLLLSVEDNGQGVDEAANDVWADGLGNMRQRLTSIGGSLEFRSEAGVGASVRIRFPWPKD